MRKVALMGSIHEDGIKILKDSKFDIIEITNYSFENLRKEDPESIDILLTLGKAYYLFGNEIKSKELFKRCQGLASDDKKDMVDRYISSIVNV